MSDYETIKEMLEKIVSVEGKLSELYEVLPRNDYCRLKQLLEETDTILKRNRDILHFHHSLPRHALELS